MGISRKTRRQIIDMLTPYLTPERREKIVRGAFWGDSLLERISWEGDAPAFTLRLVNTALMDGPLDDGEDALRALLEEVRLLMPTGERETVDALLTDLRGETALDDDPAIDWDRMQTTKLRDPESFENRRTEVDVVEEAPSTPPAAWADEDTLTDVLPATDAWALMDTMGDGSTHDDLAAAPVVQNKADDTEVDDEPPDYFEAAALLLAERDYDGAVGLYMRAIERRIDPAEAHYQIGRVMEILRQYDEALAHYEQSLTLLPDERVHTRRGVIYALRGEREPALQEFDRATRTEDPDPAAHFYRAMLHFDESNYDDALVDLDRAIDLRPDYANAHRERGVIFTVRKVYDEALTAYSTAITYNPDDAEAYFYRANVHAQQDNAKAAYADYTAAAARDVDHPQYRYHRGKFAVGMERYTDAIPDLEAAVRLNDANADAHFLLALCKMKAQAAYAEAETLLERALKLAPGNAEYSAAMRIAQAGRTDE